MQRLRQENMVLRLAAKQSTWVCTVKTAADDVLLYLCVVQNTQYSLELVADVTVETLGSEGECNLTPPHSDTYSPAHSPSSMDSSSSGPNSPVFHETVTGRFLFKGDMFLLDLCCVGNYFQDQSVYSPGLFADGTDALMTPVSGFGSAVSVTAAGMGNASRMILCVALLGVLALNPLSMAIGQFDGGHVGGADYSSARGGGRNILWCECGIRLLANVAAFHFPLQEQWQSSGHSVSIFLCSRRRRLGSRMGASPAVLGGERAHRRRGAGAATAVGRTGHEATVPGLSLLLAQPKTSGPRSEQGM